MVKINHTCKSFENLIFSGKIKVFGGTDSSQNSNNKKVPKVSQKESSISEKKIFIDDY